MTRCECGERSGRRGRLLHRRRRSPIATTRVNRRLGRIATAITMVVNRP